MLRTPLEMQIAVRSCVPLNIYPPTWRWAVGSPVAGSSGTRTVRITHIWKGDVGVTSGRNGRSHTWVERTVSRNGRCFQSILCAFWACQLRVKTMVLSPSPLISHLLVIHLLTNLWSIYAVVHSESTGSRMQTAQDQIPLILLMSYVSRGSILSLSPWLSFLLIKWAQ